MSSYVPPHQRKESTNKNTNNFRNESTANVSKSIGSIKKTFAIIEKEFPTLINAPSIKSNERLDEKFASNSFVAVASSIPQNVDKSQEQFEEKYDKSIYRKNYIQKKPKNVPVFPPRIYDSNGWMENEDYIEWFEYTYSKKVY